jgi:hypothetical protein
MLLGGLRSAAGSDRRSSRSGREEEGRFPGFLPFAGAGGEPDVGAAKESPMEYESTKSDDPFIDAALCGVGVMCGVGVTSRHSTFVAQVAGFSKRLCPWLAIRATATVAS